ncbi:MAG: DUF4388 domain-containing protein [Deltaproteobacteria bacterium]|nr:DUF4388 domain-containing protein [Deltaproteobacteria bacterium]
MLLLSRRGAFREPLEQAFEKAGITVIFAVDIATALPVFADLDKPVPAGVVIDLLTIDDDATELCVKIRERPDAESIPILFIGTGQEGIRSTTDALVAGGDGFFQLPVEAPRVVAKVAAYLGVPLPVLPHGLLVTIDDHDLLERTPEPSRLVFPPPVAGDLVASSPEADLAGIDDDERTPPQGRGAEPDDFGDTTTPFVFVGGPTKTSTALPSVARGPNSLEDDAIAAGAADVLDDAAIAAAEAEAAGLLEEHASHEASEIERLNKDREARVVDDATQQIDLAELKDRAEDRARTDEEARAARAAAAAAEAKSLQELEDEQNRDAVRAAALEAERVGEENRLRLLEEHNRAAAVAAAQEQREQRDRLQAQQVAEQARLAELVKRRAEMERTDREAAATQEQERKAEEALLQELVERRRRAEEEALEAEAKKQEEQQAEERRLKDLVERRRRAEAEALEAEAKKEEEQEAEEARLQELVDRRRRAEEAAVAAEASTEQERQAEEARLQELIERRRRAEEAALAAEANTKAERVAEEASLQELIERRRRAELEATLAESEKEELLRAEGLRLREIEERRRTLEEEAERFVVDKQEQRANEEVRLQEIQRRRQEAEAEAAIFNESRQRRIAEEAAELEILSRRRAEQEEELREIQEAQRLREAEEDRQREEGIARRQALAESDARDDDERRARIAAEEQRLQALAQERERLAQEQEQLASTFQEQEGQDRLRLAELEIARQRAEEAFAETRAATAALIDTEEAKLQALREEREQKEREGAVVVDEQRRRAQEEQQRLEALVKEKREIEQRSAELTKKLSDNEMLARARLAELEIARLRAEEEVTRVQQEAQQREAAAAAAAAAAVVEQEALEEQVRLRTQALGDAASAEEERLRVLVVERERRDEEVRRADAERQQRVQQEEQRLKELVERSEAERRTAAVDVVRLEHQLAARESEAAARLDELAKEQARVTEEARREAEQLTRLRAEEEAARAALEENRSRARLAFVSGRFDALPQGRPLSPHDVGGEPRPQGDGEGVPFGGPLRDVDVEPSEPPAPLPFLAPEPTEGRFDDGELPALLLSASLLGVTGAIDITNDDGRTRRLFLEEGEPVFVSSTMAADRPEEILLRGGLITAPRHAQLRAAPPASARRMCAQLVDDGALKLDELFAAVRGVLTEQVLALFEWGAGSFRFVEERPFAADRVRLSHGLPAIIAEGVRRKFDEDRLWAVLGGPQTLLGPQTMVGRPAGALPPLSAEETLALARLDGTRALDDVILESGLHPHAVLRAALIGVTTGAVRVLARGLPRGPSEVIARRERGVSIDRARVVDKLALARHGDYFSFLGVDVDATAFEVHRAAQRLRERFDPSRYKDSAFSDLLTAVQEIYDVAGDAEAVLADPGLKDSYRKNLRAPSSSPSKQHRQRG